MKKFRPYQAGFIVLYVLAILCTSDALYSLYGQATGTANEYMQSFSLFSYLIAALAIVYVKMYATTRVEIGNNTFHFVNPVYIKPAPGAKRASFLFRQGENDIKKVDKRVPLLELEKYGYIEDLGYDKLDRSGAGENNALFPVHEVALVMKDGKRYHWNAANYNWKQLQQIIPQIERGSGVKATGKLADVMGYTEESVRRMKEEQKAAKKNDKKGGKGKKKKKEDIEDKY